MFWLKSCPKCGGNLYEDRDQYGAFISCVQCGHYLTQAEEVLLRYMNRPSSSGPRSKTEKIKEAKEARASRETVGVGR